MNINKYICYVVMLVVAIISYPSWFFSIESLTYSDWMWYSAASQQNIFGLPNIWRMNGLGGVDYGIGSQFLTKTIFGLFGYFASFGFTERVIFLIPTLLLGAFSTFNFSRFLYPSNLGALLASFIYTYSTYLIILRTGHFTLALAYSVSIPALHLLLKHFESCRTDKIILIGLLCGIIGLIEARVMYMMYIIIFIYAFYLIVYNKTGFVQFSRIAYAGILIVLIAILLNGFWLVGISLSSSLSTNEIVNREIFGAGFMSPLRSLLIFHPFWTMDGPTIFESNDPSFYSAIYLIFAIYCTLIFKPNKNILFIWVIFICGVFLSKLISPPFGFVYKLMFDFVPGFSLFRESSKFYFMSTLAIALIVGPNFGMLVNRLKGQKFKLLIIGIALFTVSLVNITGIITPSVKYLTKPVEIPTDDHEISKFLESSTGDFRVLYLPKPTRWASFDPSKPAVDLQEFIKYSSNNDFDINDIAYLLPTDTFKNLLDKYSIRFLVVTSDSEDLTSDFGGEYKQFDYIKNILANTGKYNLAFQTNNDARVYENTGYKPRIYGIRLVDNGDSFELIKAHRLNQSAYYLNTSCNLENIYFNDVFSKNWLLINSDFKLSHVFTDGFNYVQSINNDGINSFEIDKIPAQFNNDECNYYLLYYPQVIVIAVIVLTIVSICILLIYGMIYRSKEHV